MELGYRSELLSMEVEYVGCNKNRKNLATVWKVISCSQGKLSVVGWLVGFSDFQRKPRFGSKIAKSVADL